MANKKNGKAQSKYAWLYKDPSVRMPYEMMKHEAWMLGLSFPARTLYLHIRMSMFDEDFADSNVDEKMVVFYPGKVPWMKRSVYIKAIKNLIEVGFMVEVSPGGHGKKAIYDITTLKWCEWVGKRNERR